MSDATTDSGREAAGPLTEEESAELVAKIRAFREDLPPRQRDALDAIVQAGASAVGDDVQGYSVPLLGVFAAQVQHIKESQDIHNIGVQIFGPGPST
jgi:hypothetical protein